MMESPDPAAPRSWANTAPDAAWHPDIQAIFRYWRSISPASGLPGRQHLNPADIKPLLPGVWLLDIQPAPFRLRYRLVGTRVVYLIGRDVTGRWLDEAHEDIASKPGYYDRYRRVVETGIPSWRRGLPVLSVLQDFGVIENLVMPFAADGRHPDMLLAYTAMHEPERRPPA
jgi:hypothetical protein